MSSVAMIGLGLCFTSFGLLIAFMRLGVLEQRVKELERNRNDNP